MDDDKPKDSGPWEEKLKGKKIVEGEIQSRDDKEFPRSELPKKHRLIKRGDLVTRDFHPDRLNVHLDEEGKCSHCNFG